MKTHSKILFIAVISVVVLLGIFFVYRVQKREKEEAITTLFLASRASRNAADGDLEQLKNVLARHPESMNNVDVFGATPLHAAAFGRGHAIELLLENGADPNSKEPKRQQTPLHWVAQKGPNAEDKKNQVAMLGAHGADLNARDVYGAMPLHYAAIFGYTDVAAELLTWGASIDARDMEGVTPLHMAACEGQADTVQFLLAQGADPTLKTTAEAKNRGVTIPAASTARDNALLFGHTETAELLKEEVPRPGEWPGCMVATVRPHIGA